jgi:hypothetical protein
MIRRIAEAIGYTSLATVSGFTVGYLGWQLYLHQPEVAQAAVVALLFAIVFWFIRS